MKPGTFGLKGAGLFIFWQKENRGLDDGIGGKGISV
jgi:hypothetical protein